MRLAVAHFAMKTTQAKKATTTRERHERGTNMRCKQACTYCDDNNVMTEDEANFLVYGFWLPEFVEIEGVDSLRPGYE